MKNQFVKILFIITAFHLAGLISCNGFDDDLNCGDLKQRFYEVTELKLENFRKDESTSPNSFIPLTDSTQIMVSEYRLGIELMVELFTDNTPFFNPFITSALACSPAPAEPTEIITKIEITSNGDLIDSDGNLIVAGTLLNNFFVSEFEKKSIEELISSGTYQPSERDFLNDGFVLSELLTLNAIAADNSQPHQFSIVYELDSEKSFSATSPTIFLNP